MTTMKPCPKCHSTEHPHIEIIDDNLTASRSVKAGCTECRPDDVQLTREVIGRMDEHCDDWEGIFNHE